VLRFALRRLLWVVPSVLGVSIVAFLVLSLAVPRDGLDRAETRDRYLDLPRFFNLSPADVRTRTLAAIEAFVAAERDSPAEQIARAELVRLGGAALPVLLPRLDELEPDDRIRVAMALSPIAARMRLEHRGEIYDPERAVLFWNRFWEARGVELSEDTARTAVRRFARYGTEARAQDLERLDTFALPVLLSELSAPESPDELEQTRRLVEVIAYVTERDERVAPDASLEEAAEVVDRWRHWWLVHETDFRRLVGAERVAGFVIQTQYGKWVYETIVLGLGRDSLGRPLLAELLGRSRTTVSILVVGIALAYFLAIVLGAMAAAHRGRFVDWALTAAVLVPYALTPAVLATLLWRGASPSRPLLAAGLLLAVVLVADPMRQQREALLPELVSDHVKAARARGARPIRVVLVHGLRNALVPVTTRVVLELPMAVTGCFVIEHALGLGGLGEATLEAVARRDVSWLMTLALWGALFAVAVLVLSDVVQAVVDPRLREALFADQRRR
jgi:peptide/nickel transport system permease protein